MSVAGNGRIVSVNVGIPRTVQWKGQTVSTAIFKLPVVDAITLRRLNFDGDWQADLSVHGGENKAVYGYPSEHYASWQHEYPDLPMPWGMFGENLTTEGLHEDAVQVGDRFRVGTAEIVVTEPRMPCFKLGLRFGRDDIIRRFLASGLSGFYFRVAVEGQVRAGDPIILVQRAADSVPVSEITRLYARDKDDLAALKRILEVAALPGDWRDYFEQQGDRVAARARRRPTPVPSWVGFRSFTLRARVRESADVSSFYLAPEDGQPLPSYLPGQFLTVRLPIPGERPVVRSYSLSDAARPDSYRLTIKRIGLRAGEQRAAVGLASSYLHDRLAIGERIDVKAPAGNFTLDVTQHDRPAVLIAGGIGITPLLSMLNSVVAAQSPREIWLLYGVHDEREHIMRTHLETLASAHPNINLHVYYSKPTRELSPPGIHIGRIDLAAMQRLIRSPSHHDFYVCGPPGMMDTVTRELAAWGVPAERVHMEAFGPATIKTAVRGLSGQPDCGVDVTFTRSGVTAHWSNCESSLLELAEENAVSIDFGCRAGSCGTCVQRVLSGTVRYLHEPNAPLEADEILPCIAVPAEPLTLEA